MGLWPFGRKETKDTSVDRLLAEANAASPTASPTASAPPVPQSSSGFSLPVDDVFMIAGRGVVVTGRIESGVATVGQPVSVVRNGAVVATSRINGIEKFRAVLESAGAGENVGLLLDAMTRDQVMGGDLVQG